jgi:glycopeptide antibiotics resistance protein
MTRRSWPFAVGALVYLAIIGWVTLGPPPWQTRAPMDGYDVLSLSTWLDPRTWASLPTREFVANILMFVPLGMLVRLGLPRASWRLPVFLGAAVSLAIEVLQVGSPRVSDPRDVVANVAGALVGAAVAFVVTLVAARGANRRVSPSASPRRAG